MALNVECKGKEYPALTYEVTASRIKQYADATNEVSPLYSGEHAVIPPAFPIVPAGPAIRAVFEDQDLGVNMARLVQSEQEHIFHAPVKAGDWMTVRSHLKDVTGGDAGESFSIATSLSTDRDDPAVELISSMVIRGGAARRAAGAASADDLQERRVLFETSETVDEDQTFRYAEASGDHNLIHVDPDFARNSAGLPGIIVHGMCTMAFALRAVLDAVGNGDPLRLKSIKVQFSRPVFPGQTLTTRGWLIGDMDGKASVGFETLNPRGQQVIREGLAVVAP